MRTSTIVLPALLLVCAGAVNAQDEPKEQQPSLDAQLLDDLDSELFDGLDKEGASPDAKDAPSSLDADLLEQLGDGEDIGETDPLTKIAKRMRVVEERIGASDTSERTQMLQKQIISELATLIAVQKKKCSQCAGGSQKKPNASKNSSGKKPGDKPSKDSTNRVGQGKTEEVVHQEEVQEMLKRIWGHLPPRLREQIQSASIEEFLPKYESLIEKYYERLSEQKR